MTSTNRQETDDNSTKSTRKIPDDIRDYAESTMNELLCWYGYGDNANSKVNASNKAKRSMRTRRKRKVNCILNIDSGNKHHGEKSAKRLCDEDSDAPSSDQNTNTLPEQQHKSPSVVSSEEDVTEPRERATFCSWCQREGKTIFSLKANGDETKEFCSEICFSQCRRASFKKNKICDWCKRIRQTVNSVDLEDGDQQLQFCTDSCLNQYKMNIFCREAQAHLHLQSNPKKSTPKMEDRQKLITPEMWIKKANAKSTGGNDKRQPRDQTSTSTKRYGREIAPLKKKLFKLQDTKSNSECPKSDFRATQTEKYDKASITRPMNPSTSFIPRIFDQPIRPMMNNILMNRHVPLRPPLPFYLPNRPFQMNSGSFQNPGSCFGTVIPYPVIIPLPIPIPIPLPLGHKDVAKIFEQCLSSTTECNTAKKNNENSIHTATINKEQEDSSPATDSEEEDIAQLSSQSLKLRHKSLRFNLI